MILTLERQRLQFSPSLLPTLAAALMLGLTWYLGHWQQGRAAEKRGLQAQYDARATEPVVRINAQTRDPELRYRRAVAMGEWVAERQIYVDNKVNHETAGYHVITPLKLDGGNGYLLVNRGWVRRAATYPAPPQVAVPPGPVRVAGMLSIPTSRFLELSSASMQGNVWQNLTTERFRNASGMEVLPYVLLSQDAGAGLEPVAEIPDARVEKHVEYMFTWYSLAATVVVLWLVMNIKRTPSIAPNGAANNAIGHGENS